MKIFSGTANTPLARAICKSIGIELGRCNITPFPDGETFVKIEENVRGEDVYHPADVAANKPQSDGAVHHDHALRRASAKRITAVIPF